MSTVDMLEGLARTEEATHYAEWLAANDVTEGLKRHATSVGAAVADPIYGPVVASNLEHFRTTDGIDPALVQRAVGTLCLATRSSGENYVIDSGSARPIGWYMGVPFIRALKHMQRGMTEGAIDGFLLPDEYAMTAAEGRHQVHTADRLLRAGGPAVGRLLADANYSLYFSNATMAGAAELLGTSIDEVVENTSEGQMPHLTRTNLAIGQILRGITENHIGQQTIIDTGSGTGATLAADIAGICEATSANLNNVSVYGIESNPDFMKVLEEFSGPALDKLREANPGFTLQFPTKPTDLTTPEMLSLIQGDLAETIFGLESLPQGKSDIAIVTANYVWHRLPNAIKAGIVRKIGSLSPNSIFLIADLVEDASLVNRRYFNFGNNGPLNCGNPFLAEMLRSHGYKVRRLTSANAPKSVHPQLAAKIEAEGDNDGHLWIAYKGDEAERLVTAA